MPSRHLLDPELAMLGAMTQDVNLEALRSGQGVPAPAPPPPNPNIQTREVFTKGENGAPDVRSLLHMPAAPGKDRPAVLHFHGGGYIFGAPAATSPLVESFGAVVLSVDYRLAPETKTPGPVEDGYSALKWLYAEADDLGIDRSRIVISGESAGGGVAAALALMARDRKEVSVSFQHLIFPMIDDRTVVDPDPSPFIGQFVWTRGSNGFGWSSLLDCEPGSPDVSCYAAAARATDLAGLPPTFIVCGALDLFVEENIDYAKRLIHAGVPTELHIYPGAPHGFQMAPNAQVAKAAHQASSAALARALTKKAIP